MSRLVSYTRNADSSSVNQGKNPLAISHAKWKHTESSITDLVRFSYIDGRTLSYSVYDMSPLTADEKTERTAKRWRGSSIVMIDVDRVEGYTIDDLRRLPFVEKYAAAVYPSSSYAPDTLKVHIVFVTSDVVTDAVVYDETWQYVAAQFPFAVDRATRTPVQAIFGTVFTHPTMQRHTKALDDGLCIVNEGAALLNVPAIIAERITLGVYRQTNNDAPLETFHLTSDDESISKRALAHEEAPDEKKLSVTLEALRYALKGWGESDTRDERLPLIMSAFAASNDIAVRDTFIDHSAHAWDESNQKATLSTWWASHRPKSGGYTAATLFYAARHNGWLQRSSVELSAYETINAAEVGDWLTTTELPSRVLLKSGTGTGKTRGAIRLLKQLIDEDEETHALFIAPSIKLCVALSNTLTREGVTNTLYIDNGKTKDADTLREAKILVTTLQTFGVKLAQTGINLKKYKLVVMDESDELVSSFVRSGIGGGIGHASHVTREQARFGVDSLVAIFRDAERVLLLDGTATDLSRFVMEELSPRNSTGVYVNTFRRPKAPVYMFSSLAGLRNDIVNTVSTGARVVIAADTKSEAALIETLLILCEVVEPDNVLRITGDTATDSRVSAFFDDVEAGAQKYQVIIYNSAMGSGVSIERTKPDVVYLLASYLSPRKLLQLMNRYRQQMVVKAHVVGYESLYSTTVDERYERLQEATKNESALAALSMQSRTAVAETVARAALIAATDDYDQTRSVRDFFTRLLYDDGRSVSYVYADKEALKEETSDARTILRNVKESVLEGWRSVEPIERGDAVPKDVTPDYLAKGILHATIRKEFETYDVGTFDLSDADIARLALKFRSFRRTIEKWLKPERIMNITASELYDRTRETVTFRLYFSRIEVISLLGELFPDLQRPYTDEEIEKRSSRFVKEVSRRRPTYDIVASEHLSFENVTQRVGDDPVQYALSLANGILKSIGLKVKRTNGKRRKDGSRDRVTKIDGVRDLYTYLAMRGGFEEYETKPIIAFNRATFKDAADRAKEASNQFKVLSIDEQREILGTLNMVDGITFDNALSTYQGKQFAVS
jgi:hypothetical protein